VAYIAFSQDVAPAAEICDLRSSVRFVGLIASSSFHRFQKTMLLIQKSNKQKELIHLNYTLTALNSFDEKICGLVL